MGLLAIPLGIGAAVGAEPRIVAGQLIAAPAGKQEPDSLQLSLRHEFGSLRLANRSQTFGATPERAGACPGNARLAICSFQ
ncbi:MULTISPECIES: hypothetical protein [unclassified Crossiella]|uniref:hypothetical protein n=1 Tax=unclassified Crossiella TaxID=2620835 RepID=UPI001FFE7C6A|nr:MULTISPECIES: hypothetical protein [unclassified Crossiella]MCK2243393.1 hypothetical protein [Crossiella sp. S99.2]MCK2254138.1 hypothetical protein [Crossiella sp. S99.1]